MTLDEFEQSMRQGMATEQSAQQGLSPQVFAGVGKSPMRTKLPLGAVSLPGDTGLWAVGAYVLLSGAAGFFAGKAMAPSPDRQTTYGLVGAASSIVLGPLGLGIVGVYSLVKR